jgi:hypothetical protein
MTKVDWFIAIALGLGSALLVYDWLNKDVHEADHEDEPEWRHRMDEYLESLTDG